MTELARGNYLRPNGLGGYLIRQSDLSSWSRCQLQKHYYDRASHDVEAQQPEALSATVYGTVLHFCLQQIETFHHEGHDNPLAAALKLWEHYWDLDNMTLLPGVQKITQWLPRQTYMGLKIRGRETLRLYYDALKRDTGYLLALEYQFAVPLELDGRTHTVTGTIDRLAVRQQSRKPYVSVEDFKTGKKPTYLRYNGQGSLYAWATTQPTFWLGWPESGMGALETFDSADMKRLDDLFARWGFSLYDGLHDDLPAASRRFYWLDMQDVKRVDGGWRVLGDYERIKLAVDAYIRANEAGIYSVNWDSSVCAFCPFKGSCAGVGLPHPTVGAP